MARRLSRPATVRPETVRPARVEGLKRVAAALALASALCWPHAARTEAPPAAPAMLLAKVYAADVDVTQYWVSEKFDGVRAQWDGHVLRFRGGGLAPAPAWFTADFPRVPLDGELWIARDAFDALSGTVRKAPPVDAEWRRVRYLVFELPGAPGDFSARVGQMREVIEQAAVPWLEAVAQTRVASREDLMQRLDAEVRAGGEGLMLHRADAPYLTGRSDALLKLKPWLDAEAIVVGYVPGKGKYAGMTGALRMETPDGKRFRLGSGLSDALRRQPPPVGTRITYRYTALTKNGMPRFPRYLRVREDF
ncbi:DNA ligase, ATP-dependent [Thiobacillus denitrificans ATCC 25259]|uniref:DNA ligase, ATP-dependent n=1 Tax=Thiobacillus denitrificans (strain ATCC 25259 / T1) TaxID=292415 RepID=Q3SKL4_THIDA|nr:DNA ligase [Thiobacillus denitrificans]AAZ96765.1 DNA ligase, ATP-dependent [Thiobacillus denitrificans ATCC 25259]